MVGLNSCLRAHACNFYKRVFNEEAYYDWSVSCMDVLNRYLTAVDECEPVTSSCEATETDLSVRGNPQGLKAAELVGVSANPNSLSYNEKLRMALATA